VKEEIPVLALVSRLVVQKGLDLLAHILEELLQEEIQLVVLGTGEERYENLFRYFAARYPEKLAAAIKFDESLARKIYAGADLLLMPSLFEPCGLSQMIAMRYGTVPLVRETGGLRDTVIPYNRYTGEGNGFSFANYNAHELLFTAKEAIRVYRENKEAWQHLRQQAYETDCSWEQPARRYVELYCQLIDES
jgi:starch synthase